MLEGAMSDLDRKVAKILLVDDEPTNLKLLDKLLRGQGYDNLTLIQDARLVAEQCLTLKPDLILLDINMPYLDGFGVMETLQEAYEGLLPPIIVLTAQHNRDVMIRALSVGARDFVTKPFDRVELLMRVANQLEVQVAHRIVNDQKEVLEVLVQERTDMLNQTRLQIVQRLGRAAEYRDNETGYHILRMSEISALLARSLGWSECDCELMLNASPMHDVGKIGIPDVVLLKPGKLNAEEWEIMKTHSSVGAELLSEGHSELLDLASLIALHHHEKWDGSGYPSGLQGEAIPQAARIVAVADVFDALTSTRPYKKAWPVADAVAHIQQEVGRHFDPQVVEHFLLCLDEIQKIRDRYVEPGV